MSGRVLHLLSQRPARTGSGITLEALLREAGGRGWRQAAVVGIPAGAPRPALPRLDPGDVHPLWFGAGDLDFPLPGMSDVMPYPSSRFRDLSPAQIERYRSAWRDHVARVIDAFRPDLVHAHHLWLLSALVKDVAPEVGLVVHSHATGLRQMARCPHLGEVVAAGCVRADAVLALSHVHARAVARALCVPRAEVHVVGAGYDSAHFHPGPAGEAREREGILYVGKVARAKGVPWLLDAFDRLRRRHPGARLHVAGSGAGPEAEALGARLRTTSGVVVHGHLDQAALARLMRRVTVFVLPSLYEGLPLVLVEALACGARSIVTALPVVTEDLVPALGDLIGLVPCPRLEGSDEVAAADEACFVAALEAALERALGQGAIEEEGLDRLAPFTWDAVFARIERIWGGLAGAARRTSDGTPEPRRGEDALPGGGPGHAGAPREGGGALRGGRPA
ncbi:MAG: glycosyltransferase family 4 protein, partial [Planctomycetota bacterium]